MRARSAQAGVPPLPAPQAEDASAPPAASFAHLLRPIRDLADNWAVDIANDLEDYAHTLEQAESEKHHVNFAEAALLLTGSANVYGKKVESLYELVFAALETTSAATGDVVDAVTGRKKPKEQQDDVAQSYVDEFLLLDDVIPVADEESLTLAQDQRNRDRGLVPQAPLALAGARSEGTMSSLAMTSWLPSTVPEGAVADSSTVEDASYLHDNNEQEMILGDEDNAPPPPSEDPRFHDDGGAWVFLDPDVADHANDKTFKRGKTHVVPACFVEGELDLSSSMLPQPKNERGPFKMKPITKESELLEGLAKVRLGQFIFDEVKQCAPARRKAPGADASGAGELEPSEFSSSLDQTGTYEDSQQEMILGDEADDFNDTMGDASGQGSGEEELRLSSEQVAQVPESYSDLVRAHVSRFLEQARNWAQESKLALRVRAWQDHIEPILLEQESRPVFDIVESETELMRDLTPGHAEPFTHLVHGEEAWGASRLFLAALQLSNEGCVELLHPERCPSEYDFSGTELDVLCKTMLKLRMGSHPNTVPTGASGLGGRKKAKG